MKKIMCFFVLLLTINAARADESWTPEWDGFGYEIQSAKYGHFVNILGLAKVIRKSSTIVLKVDGTIASCGFGPFFVKWRTKVLNCSPERLDIEIEYRRTDPCDQAMVVEGKTIKVKLPDSCEFSLAPGHEIYLGDRPFAVQ